MMSFKHEIFSRVFVVGLAALAASSCGRKGEKGDSGAPSAPPATEQANTTGQGTGSGNSQVQGQTPAAPTSDEIKAALGVEILNKDDVDGKSFAAGESVTIEFARLSSKYNLGSVILKCKLETAAKAFTAIANESDCDRQVTVKPENGTYIFTVTAVQADSIQRGESVSVMFSVGERLYDSGDPMQGGAQLQKMQVGDMLEVNVPQGFHMVYRTSTFDNPGFLNFQYINGGSAVDASAPYVYRCNQGANFESIDQIVSPSGLALEYCTMTPAIRFSAGADPFYNSFRWMNMSTMSYNSMLISTDTSLKTSRSTGQVTPSLAKLYTTVFTNVGGIQTNPTSGAFASELSQTVSRLNISCHGQQIQYLGDAAVFQGFFSWQVASAPLFGCLTRRNNQYWVDIAAFPIEAQLSMLPGNGWNSWISQNFANLRAAEIVVEIGPFGYGPAPITLAQEAQSLMVANIKKLMPSAMPSISQPVNPNPTGPAAPCRNRCERPRRSGWFGR